jgi:hypothetical protein
MTRIPKGKAKSVRNLHRGQPTRERYDRILIVCEGKKTEPNYFREIRQEARISTLDICILHCQEGTQPLQVVNFAEAEFNKTKRFEKVFAVFDRDDHITYANAIAKAGALSSNAKLVNDEGKQIIFKAIVSVPCFELWLLLHYVDIQAYFHRDIILRRLRSHIVNYEKGQKGLYKLTQDLLTIATERAKHLRTRFSHLPGNEAYTDIDELVDILRSIKPNNR